MPAGPPILDDNGSSDNELGEKHETSGCGQSIEMVCLSKNRHRIYPIVASSHLDEYLVEL